MNNPNPRGQDTCGWCKKPYADHETFCGASGAVERLECPASENKGHQFPIVSQSREQCFPKSVKEFVDRLRPEKSATPPDAGKPRTDNRPTNEPMYPCAKCDLLRTKAEGGGTFTVCDECWDDKNSRPPANEGTDATAEIVAHYGIDLMADIKPLAELQLLVIDLGDSCVVKVEKGDPAKIFPAIIVSAWKNDTAVIACDLSGFDSVKASIDRLASDEKPVPRIEKFASDTGPTFYNLIQSNESSAVFPLMLDSGKFKAISALAGRPLPIYKERRGKWVRTSPTEFDEQELADEIGMPLTDVQRVLSGVAERFQTPTDMEIWRFTLSEGE